MADKDSAMPSRIAAAPLDLGVGHYKTFSVFDVRASEWFVVAFVSDDGDILIAIHLITVSPNHRLPAHSRASADRQAASAH